MNVFRPRVSKKTILLISIILCTFAINTIAQVDGKIRREIKERNLSKDMLTNEQFFNEAEFIIEGKIVPQQHYSYDGKGEYNPKDIYTMNKFVVSYIYKGDKLLIKVNDTIVLVKNRGTIYKKTPNKYSSTMFDYKAVYSWGEREPSEGYDDIGLYIEPDLPSVLFCKKSDYPENPNSEENYSNYFKIKLLRDKERASLKIWSKITGLNGLSFNNREELFEYMQQFEGVSGQNYYDTYNAFWKEKWNELEEFKENFPKFDLQSKLENGKLPKEAYFEYRNVAIKYLQSHTIDFPIEYIKHSETKKILNERDNYFKTTLDEVDNLKEVKEAHVYTFGEDESIQLKMDFKIDTLENNKKNFKREVIR